MYFKGWQRKSVKNVFNSNQKTLVSKKYSIKDGIIFSLSKWDPEHILFIFSFGRLAAKMCPTFSWNKYFVFTKLSSKFLLFISSNNNENFWFTFEKLSTKTYLAFSVWQEIRNIPFSYIYKVGNKNVTNMPLNQIKNLKLFNMKLIWFRQKYFIFSSFFKAWRQTLIQNLRKKS